MANSSPSPEAEFNEMRDALRLSEARFEAFMTHTPALCWLVDGTDRLVFLSPSFARAWRVDAATAAGRTLGEVLPEAVAKALVDHADRARQTGRPVEGDVQVPAAVGLPAVYRVTLFPLPADPDRRSVGGIALQVSEQKRLEQQLRQSQRLESLGLLADGVAHNFNNMLTIIRVNAELLSLTPGLPTDVVRNVQQITEAAERSAQLTTQLLAFSRQQAESIGIYDLNEIVRRTADLFAILLGRKVAIDAQFAPAPVRLEGDMGTLEQLLLALAINARDAMPSGGRFMIRIEVVEIGATEAARHPGAAPGPHARLVVSDTGTGMPPEVLARAFEPFFTTKGGRHTGLGLSTVYGYVTQHHGWIEAASAPGEGATFTIHLPVAKPPPALA